MSNNETTENSKELWGSVIEQAKGESVVLSPKRSELYHTDPKQFAFYFSRYKFCAKLLAGKGSVLELGCGDGMGTQVIAAEVEKLIATDIDEFSLENNRERNAAADNVEFKYFDFRENAYTEQLDAIYTIDVIEHIYPEEESKVMANAVNSLKDHGVMIIGTPNKSAEQYASKWSKIGHINLKTHSSLRELGLTHFHNVFMFGMNDEVVHTGFPDMCHFLWALCVTPRR